MKDILMAFLLMALFTALISGFVWLCVVTSGIPMIVLLVLVFWGMFYDLIQHIKGSK